MAKFDHCFMMKDVDATLEHLQSQGDFFFCAGTAPAGTPGLNYILVGIKTEARKPTPMGVFRDLDNCMLIAAIFNQICGVSVGPHNAMKYSQLADEIMSEQMEQMKKEAAAWTN